MGFSTRGFSDDEDIELHLHPHWLVFAKPALTIVLGLILASASTQIADTAEWYETVLIDRKSTRLNSSHSQQSRMPSSA